MSNVLETLAAQLQAAVGERLRRYGHSTDALAMDVASADLIEVSRILRDDPALKFEILIDASGVDYLGYGLDEWQTTSATVTGFSRGANRAQSLTSAPAQRFAVVYQLLSLTHNRRLRLRAFCEGDEDPAVDSLCAVWAGANWFEREAYDLFGIYFRGHPDLRRLLTDYGFIGHPFRKDFPLIGNVEVRYDATQQRVVYEPVTIEPRTLVPRVIRNDNRYQAELHDRPDGSRS